MSRADRSRYAAAVTDLSRGELRHVLGVAEPPVCLLGGWAVHLHVNDGFRNAHDRDYVGSRDIDVGIHVDRGWTVEDVVDSSVAETLRRIESELGYSRGRFGFYEQFHRETGERLDDERARELASHDVFRVDVDIIPDTTELEAFEAAFGFRPPAEPLLERVFTSGSGEHLGEHVDWDVPEDVQVPPPAALAAMKVRALPDRDRSHKRLKDVADLHALLWYVTDYDAVKTGVRSRTTDDDVTAFRSNVDGDLCDRAAGLIDIDSTVLRQSVERLFV